MRVIVATDTVYGRSYQGWSVPLPKWLMDGYTKFAHFMIFREDWQIVAGQRPHDVLDAQDEKLFPSDAPVIAYRKLHRARHQHWV
jgi:hypothetical protein